MKNQLKESDILRITKKVKGNNVNEGWFSNLFRSKYERYSDDMSEIMTDLVDNTYYDKKLITKIRELYLEIDKSDIDRYDKRNLLTLINRMYQTINRSKNELENLIREVNRNR